MSDADRRFHETWLGMVQPIDGLVVSIPVLVDAQCAERQPPHVQAKLLALAPPTRQGEAAPEGHAIAALGPFLSELLGFPADAFDAGEALPEGLSLYVPEGRQTIRPTLALRKLGASQEHAAPYELLVWELPAGLDLDRSESVTGSWDYPPSSKFDRLLRHSRVGIGLLTNREVIRLVYAPHGESSGAITFRLDDMASVGGRPILDAFVMLLSANRFFGVAEGRTLPALLAESRKRQASVTNELADQVFQALQILLRGFDAAAERDGRTLLDDALARGGDHLTKGLLTVLLRLVFLLYAEDRGLLPVDHPFYAAHLSVLALFDQLQVDQGAFPDSMSRRFGAWGRLVTLFRAVFLGVAHGELRMPPRRGALFNPHEYPFLEGWGPAGSAPIAQPEDRAAVKLPSVDDGTVFQVLERLLVFEGQRLSYRALDVEQIGSVYEALMGYHVERMPSAAVCMKPDRLWVSAEELLEVPPARRAKWIKETIGLSAAQSEKLAEELGGERRPEIVLDALAKFAGGGKGKKGDPSLSYARAGELVLQPGAERRRTSSHYTPRSLSAPIVRRTLEPLLAVMGDAPPSERILNLKVCDPAVGSGAFLVEACRFLADQLLLAWTREGAVEPIAASLGDPLLHARRLVAQRCLYGVDKNDAAVELAKLSLWLVTLSKTLPFTFLDHSIRHGDSLVGLDFDQIRGFHWKKPEGEAPKQLSLFGREIAVALDEAIKLRQRIGELGDSVLDDREKARLFWDAQDALDRVRLIGDLVVGAFFAHDKDKEREAERRRREDLVRSWLGTGGPAPEELLAMQREVRRRLPVFHWMVEFPEVFYAEREDPLDEGRVNRAAYMDAFVGNPPFAGKNAIIESNGPRYIFWQIATLTQVNGAADISSYFFRHADRLLGDHGTMGFIATNTISQGDTRASGLQVLLRGGARIYEATRSLPWPGAASVTVSVVHVEKGAVHEPPRLDGELVGQIDSRLEPRQERPDAERLSHSRECWFLGPKIYGDGFILTDAEVGLGARTEGRNHEVVFDLIGGEEINSSPTQRGTRRAINFGRRALAEAEQWPALMQIVRERVKPERDGANEATADGAHRKRYWWQYAQPRPELYASLQGKARCLVNSQVSKHLMFAFQPTTRVFSHTLYVFPLEACSSFATLQSRTHESWARLLSSSLEDRLRYSASDCFETFPFPEPDPRAVIPALEAIGERLYEARAKYMVDENVGLTVTYNRLKDPACRDARVLELRALHEEMDRKVLAAYAEGDPEGGWRGVEVPPFCPITDEDKAKLERFGDAVIDRLFVLNAKRAAEERGALGGGGEGKKKPRAKKAVAKGAAEGAKPRRGRKAGGGQLPILVRDGEEGSGSE